MPEIPRTKFNSPWTVAVIEAALNDVSSAKGSSESLTAALNAMRAEINSLSGGVHLKGAVDYYNDLPASPSEGDAYTVRYQGTSGTDPLGIEYAWATYQGTPQWIPIGVDPSVFAKQTEMDVVANAGAKNLFQITGTTSSSIVTVNADQTVTVNGTPSSGNISFTMGQFTGEVGKPYHLSGCPSGGSNNTWRIAISDIGYDYGDGLDFVGDGSGHNVTLFVKQSSSPVNITSKPMIRPAAITDTTFQPYSKTNRDLTVLTDEDRAALVEIVDNGAKNALQFDEIGTNTTHGTTYTVNGITFTINASGLIDVSGTATDDAYANLRFNNANIDVKDLADGYHIISGVPNGTQSGVTIRCVSGNTVYAEDTGSGSVMQYSGTSALRVQAFVATGTIISSTITLKQMICTSAAWKISQTYQPYRPSWQEMWDAIQALQSGGNRALTMQTEPKESEER